MTLNEEIKAVTPILLSWLANPAKFWSNKSNKKLRSIRNYLEPFFTKLIKLIREVNPENAATLQDLQNKNLDELKTVQKCEILRNMLQKAEEQNPEIEIIILYIHQTLIPSLSTLGTLNQLERYKIKRKNNSHMAGDNAKQFSERMQSMNCRYTMSIDWDELSEPTFGSIGSITGKNINFHCCSQIVTCSQSLPLLYVHADMDDVVIINHKVTLDVEVSRELKDWYESEASKTGLIEINDTRKLLIQVIPKANFDLDGEDRVEVEVSTLSSPAHFYFDLKANYPGNGEVWVVARQNQIPLTTLKLKPKIVQNRADIQVLNKTVQQKTLFNPPPLAEPLNQLFITEHFHGQ